MTSRAVPRSALAVCLFAAASCSFGKNPDLPKERELLLSSLAEHVLLPRYQATIDGLDALLATSEQFCAAPSEILIRTARTEWLAARNPWKESEVFAFGPYKNEPLRLGPKIDSWPARPDSIEALIDSEVDITPELLAESGVFLRGFPVIEYILFANDLDLEFAGTSRCDYLVAATKDLRSSVTQLQDAWLADGGNYIGQFATPDETGGEFDDSVEALSEVVDRLGFTAENAHAEKLTPALGLESVSGPDTTLLESRFSATAIADIKSNLYGIEAVFYGDLSQSSDAIGLNHYLYFLGHEFDLQLRELLDNAHAALDAVGQPNAAIEASSLRVSAAIESLKELQRFLQSEVTKGLNFSVGFNDTDGD